MDSKSKPYASSKYHERDPTPRYEPNDLNSSSDNDQSPVEEAYTLEGGNTDVWENLREIFEDIDAHNVSGENKQLLKKPIMHLRRLLQMHTKLRSEELTLEKIYLGLRIEREWYLRKLQAIEAAVGSLPSNIQASFEGSSRSSPTSSFTRAIHTILYEDNEDYTLVGSKWH